MDAFSTILQPLVLISGVGLLILSTSARFGQVEGEVGSAIADRGPDAAALLIPLMARARWIRLALVILYASGVLLAAASLVGGVFIIARTEGLAVIHVLTCLAALGVFAALVVLMFESRLSVDFLERRCANRIAEGERRHG